MTSAFYPTKSKKNTQSPFCPTKSQFFPQKTPWTTEKPPKKYHPMDSTAISKAHCARCAAPGIPEGSAADPPALRQRPGLRQRPRRWVGKTMGFPVSPQKIKGFRNWCIDRVEKTEIRRLKWLKWEYESDWWCDLGYSSTAVSFCKNRAALPTALASLSKTDVKFGLRLEGDQKDPVSVN